MYRAPDKYEELRVYRAPDKYEELRVYTAQHNTKRYKYAGTRIILKARCV